MSWWRWWRRDRDRPDAAAAIEQRAKLAQARAETPWIATVAAAELAKLPPEQFADRVRLAMTLRPESR